MKRLAIFGDSFSSESTGTSWITVMRNNQILIDNYSFPGTSIWYSFKKFLKNYHKYDTIIFCFSHFQRIISIPDECPPEFHSVSLHTHLGIKTKDQKKIKIITDHHMLTLDSDGALYQYLYQKNFEDVNLICEKDNIQLINLLPFETPETVFDFPLNLSKSFVAPCFCNLFGVSRRELGNNVSFPTNDSRECHISYENNIKLGNFILNYLNNNDIIDRKLVDLEKVIYG